MFLSCCCCCCSRTVLKICCLRTVPGSRWDPRERWRSCWSGKPGKAFSVWCNQRYEGLEKGQLFLCPCRHCFIFFINKDDWCPESDFSEVLGLCLPELWSIVYATSSISGEVRGHGSNDLSIYSRKTNPHSESMPLQRGAIFFYYYYYDYSQLVFLRWQRFNANQPQYALGMWRTHVSASRWFHEPVPLSCWVETLPERQQKNLGQRCFHPAERGHHVCLWKATSAACGGPHCLHGRMRKGHEPSGSFRVHIAPWQSSVAIDQTCKPVINSPADLEVLMKDLYITQTSSFFVLLLLFQVQKFGIINFLWS